MTSNYQKAFACAFQIEDSITPLEAIQLLEHKVDGRTIISLDNYVENYFVCNLTSEEPLKTLLIGGLQFNGKFIRVESIDSKLVKLAIKSLPLSVSNDSINSCLKNYGKILHIDRDRSNKCPVGSSWVYMELLNDLPKTFQVNGGTYNIE